ncbi:MAG: prepilin-type N-terminal cleavage/methylation domain-containing protein [Candidatus Hydrogenedentes bacterium]|nr:prepilin-type N-terminal cleavage/methylation domain-containing protein [Candidatus Hydrogenedentota bacterium]
MKTRGFTLIEVLIATSILVIVVAAIYASFSGVTTTMAATRVSAEEMRLRQFLERSLRTNLSALHTDRDQRDPLFRLVGMDQESPDGPADSLRFVSMAPLVGGTGLPGDLKEVRYDVLGADTSAMNANVLNTLDMAQRKLQAVETPLVASNVVELDDETGGIVTEDSLIEREDVSNPLEKAPSWSVPIRTLDISYYDGVDWQPEWDSSALGMMPWCIRVRINFARTEAQLAEEAEQRFSIVDEPDFEVVVPLPIGLGRTADGGSISSFEEMSELDEQGIPKPGDPNYDPGRDYGVGDPVTQRDMERARRGVGDSKQ